jgi:phosphoglycolate phosphatase
VLTAMLRLGAADFREVAVVSATTDGVLAGYRAGARIVAGLGTSRRAAAFLEAGATDVLDSVAGLPDLVARSS